MSGSLAVPDFSGWEVEPGGIFWDNILSVTEQTAAAYAEVRLGLKRWGHPIPANDAWIAALSLQHSLSVEPRRGL